MTTHQKIAGAVAAVVLLVILLTAVSLAIPQASSDVTFSSGSVSTSSNMSLVSIVISNPSSSGILYYVGDAEFKSNGFWEEFRYSRGLTFRPLAAGRSATNVVTVPAGSGEARVPVLWGFAYAAKPNPLQALWQDAVANIRMHNSRGRGALYTNFVSGIKL